MTELTSSYRLRRHTLHDIDSFLDYFLSLLCDLDAAFASVWIGRDTVIAVFENEDGDVTDTATLQLQHDVVFETLLQLPCAWQTAQQLAEFLRFSLPADCGVSPILERLRNAKAGIDESGGGVALRTCVYVNADLQATSAFCDLFCCDEEQRFLLKVKPGELQRIRMEAAVKLREKIVRSVEQLCGEKIPCYLGEP
jgi:hypothetical protein